MAGQRVSYFDNLKGMLIFLVVLGHFLAYLSTTADNHLMYTLLVFIYAFHMPAFIFVSGLFAYKTYTAEKGFRAENVLFYLALYLIFTLLKSFEELAMGGTFSFNPLVAGAAPWYLLVMANYALMTPLLFRLNPRVALPLLVLVAVGAMYCITLDTRGVLAVARTLAYAPVFSLGFYIGAGRMGAFVEKMGQSPRLPLMRAAALAVLVAFFAVLYLMPEHLATMVKRICTGQNTALSIGIGSAPAFVFGLARVLFYLLEAVLISAVMLLTPRRRTFLSIWGERSLQVYILHMLVIYALHHYGFNASMLAVTPLWEWSPFLMAPLVTALLAAPRAPLAWTAALKRLCKKALRAV